MTQENKDLLLKDLCARLPYKPIVHIDDCGIWNLRGIDHDDSAELRDRVIVWHGENYPSSKNSFPIINCKPYLFPLSSMTEEQWDKEFRGYGITEFTRDSFKYGCETLEFNNNNPNLSKTVKFINQLIKNHFDIYGLIPKGLAIDATGLNIY